MCEEIRTSISRGDSPSIIIFTNDVWTGSGRNGTCFKALSPFGGSFGQKTGSWVFLVQVPFIVNSLGNTNQDGFLQLEKNGQRVNDVGSLEENLPSICDDCKASAPTK